MEGPDGPAAAAYAAGLRWAVKRHTATGGTQIKMAKNIPISASSLSRYMSGQRLAPRKTLHAIKAYIEAQSPSLSFPDGFWEKLDGLCGKAHLASKSATVKVAYLLAELERAEERLRDLESQAGRLGAELGEALARAQGAEKARLFLQTRLTAQDRSLRTARDYIQRIEAELAEHRERAGLLQQEVDVLREQNRRLIEAEPPVPAPSTQLSHPGHGYAPGHAGPVPQPVEPVPAGEEGTGMSPAQWQAPPPASPGPGPAQGPWTARDQLEYGVGSLDNFTYDEAFRHYTAAATQIAWFVAQPGYQEDTVPHPGLPRDGGATDAPHDACRYHKGWTAGPLHAPADEEPPPATAPAPPVHEEDEEELRPTSAIRCTYPAPSHRTQVVLPDTAFLLLAVLVTALMCAAAAAVTELTGATRSTRWQPNALGRHAPTGRSTSCGLEPGRR
ncbi:hypothetical protein ACF087_35290 [Streptomyces goshikiensis]|uniref:hypothetical protein n=1 Tax=Streptomyces goshikiensis TaxID=1942 RepID=UPI0036F79630